MTEARIDMIVRLCHQQLEIYPAKEYNYKILKRGMEQKSLSIIENKLKVFSNKYKELIDELEAIGKVRSKMLELILDKRKMRKEFFMTLRYLQ